MFVHSLTLTLYLCSTVPCSGSSEILSLFHSVSPRNHQHTNRTCVHQKSRMGRSGLRYHRSLLNFQRRRSTKTKRTKRSGRKRERGISAFFSLSINLLRLLSELPGCKLKHQRCSSLSSLHRCTGSSPNRGSVPAESCMRSPLWGFSVFSAVCREEGEA